MIFDCKKLMPKLPCYIRTYLETWDRNQRIKESFKKSISGREKLTEPNKIRMSVAAARSTTTQTNSTRDGNQSQQEHTDINTTVQCQQTLPSRNKLVAPRDQQPSIQNSWWANPYPANYSMVTPSVQFQQNNRVRHQEANQANMYHLLNPRLGVMFAAIPNPPALPIPMPRALHTEPFVVVGRSLLGTHPNYMTPPPKKKRRGRGGDNQTGMQKHQCLVCMEYRGDNWLQLDGKVRDSV